jgi:hypothetical protein
MLATKVDFFVILIIKSKCPKNTGQRAFSLPASNRTEESARVAKRDIGHAA